MSLPSTSSRQCLSDEMVYRSLLQVASPTTMRQLCRRGDWHRVLQRIHRHPHEDVDDDCLLYAIRATGYPASSTRGLSLAVVQALLEIHPQQIQVLHPLTGTIVHEAIQYWCPNTIIEYLLQAMLQYQSCTLDSSKNLFAVQDDIGRTLLHCMVGRWQRFHVSPSTIKMRGTSTISDVQLFGRIHEAHPRQARVRDIDGYTPLLLLLQTPPPPPSSEEASNGSSSSSSPQEAEITQMVSCMLHADPTLVHLGRETRYDQQQQQQSKDVSSADATPNHIHTPLFYALLYGRSDATIQLLLDAYRSGSTDGSSYASVPLSQYQEAALHLALTTQAAVPIVNRLLQEDPTVLAQPDRDGLSPLDWFWIAALRGGFGPGSVATPRHLVSRRRQWPAALVEWHAELDTTTTTIHGERAWGETTWERVQTMLAVAAPVYFQRTGDMYDGNDDDVAWRYHPEEEPWNLLHAACLVPGPATWIRWVLLHFYGNMPAAAEEDALCSRTSSVEQELREDNDDKGRFTRDPLRFRDQRMRRYPLHYAASRVRYQKVLPPRSFLSVAPVSPSRLQDRWTPIHVVLPLYPAACCQEDRMGQLPLHIAIDTYKRHRSDGMQASLGDPLRLFYDQDEEEDAVLDLLLDCYPGALHQKDGRSQLYPWQQAASGEGARLTTIYRLFRSNPTLRW